MPILGIMASSRPAFELVGSYDSLATVNLSTATATITFTGIPSGYKHLQIRSNIGKASTGNNQLVLLRFNNDAATSKYRTHNMWGDGASAVSNDFNNVSPANSASAIGLRADSSVNTFTGIVTDILDYSNVNKNTTVRSLWGFDTNGTANAASQYGFVGITSSLWIDTSAVSTITIEGFNGNTFPQYSSFALYGIK